jgi:integrase
LAQQEVLDPRRGHLTTTGSPSPSYKAFIEAIKTDATRRDYLKGLKYFMEFCKFTPGDYDALLQNNDSKIIQSRKMYIAAIKKFYVQNDILLNWDKINSYKPERCRVVEDAAYTRDQIQKMLSVCGDIRDKALVLLLASTGMRIGAVSKLRLKDVTPIDLEALLPQGGLYQVTVYKKARQQYICYTTNEARASIDQYLANNH